MAASATQGAVVLALALPFPGRYFVGPPLSFSRARGTEVTPMV